MKKILAFLLAICILLAMTACSDEDEDRTLRPDPAEDTTETAPSTTPSVPTETIPASEPAVPDYQSLYDDIIADFSALVRYRFSDSFDSTGLLSFPGISSTMTATLSNLGDLDYRWECMVIELSFYSAADDPRYYGYILHDLNADGIPELFWVRNDHSIVAIFTYHNKGIMLLDAFWSRYQGYIAWDNSVYTWGSSGAADSHCSCPSLTTNGILYEEYGFASESSWDAVNFYEYSRGTKTRISQDRYHSLCEMYPRSHSQYWMSLPITALSGIPETKTFQSYLVKVPRGDFPIWSGPGYSYSQTGTVEISGTYTIVAEAQDGAGNLWGKLKSGAGWVDLTQLEKENANPTPIRVGYADQSLLQSGNYHHFVGDTSEYAVALAFRTQSAVTNMSFFSIDCSVGYEEGPALFHIDRWDPGRPFVVQVSFPGDMTMYGIRFTDGSGATHRYSVMMSGSDIGPAFSLTPYSPTN